MSSYIMMEMTVKQLAYREERLPASSALYGIVLILNTIITLHFLTALLPTCTYRRIRVGQTKMAVLRLCLNPIEAEISASNTAVGFGGAWQLA